MSGLGFLAALLLASPVQVQPVAAPHASWDRPSPSVQKEMDATLLPFGRGGVLVPTMTDPRREPRYVVLDADGRTIATTEAGSVTVLPPGEYVVRVGSGPIVDQLEIPVTVIEARTSIVEPAWAGLQITVVSDRGVPFRGAYELMALPQRSSLGIGFGARVEMGEEVPTWILKPGTYMLLRPGETAAARANFFTLRVRPGHLERYTLVLDDETGDFLGAGEVQLAEARKKYRNVFLSMLGGGSLLFTQRENVVGTTPGRSFAVDLYFDAIAKFIGGAHHVYGRLKVEEGQTKQPTTPFQISVDEVALDAIYIYKLLPWIGPYVRGGLDSKLFKGYHYFSDPTTVIVGRWRREDPDGARAWEQLELKEGAEEHALSNYFFPITVDSGTGFNVDLSFSYWLDLSTRVGVGLRQTWYDGLLQETSVPDEYDTLLAEDVSRIAFERVDDSFRTGMEAALILNARLTRWVLLTVELEALEPFEEPEAPILDLYTNAGIRLSSFASLNYIVDLLYDRNVSEEPQVEQRLMLRFSYKFF
jgi:hypothetical protein